MDYQRILTIAEDKLGNEFSYIVKDIKECIASGSTGGEISSMVGKYLKDLEINNKLAYSMIKEDVQFYLLQCKKHGLLVR